MTRNQLKEIVKNIIREDSSLSTPGAGTPPTNYLSYGFTKPYLKKTRVEPATAVEKTIDYIKNPDDYKYTNEFDEWKANMEQKPVYKFLDKVGDIIDKKKIDINLPKDKGQITLGKIGKFDPYTTEYRTEHSHIQDMHRALGGDIPNLEKPSDIFGVNLKWNLK